MRVIAGICGGRIFESPHGHRTHPMSEKMRGAIFASLGDLHDLNILDAFSGSGALGIEAVSRGAKSVISIEVDKRAHSIIEKNIKSLSLDEQIKSVRAYVNAWSTRHPNQFFDVILADPPYDDIPHRDMKSLPKHLSEDGILVLSWPSKFDWYPFVGLEMFKQKTYGDSQLIYYKKSSS